MHEPNDKMEMNKYQPSVGKSDFEFRLELIFIVVKTASDFNPKYRMCK